MQDAFFSISSTFQIFCIPLIYVDYFTTLLIKFQYDIGISFLILVFNVYYFFSLQKLRGEMF
jgi:hypothetical protein